jgi:uncharacterized protein (UPF0179 family)
VKVVQRVKQCFVLDGGNIVVVVVVVEMEGDAEDD